MKCYQCSNNAMYKFGEEKIPLCLSCFNVVQQIQQRNIQTLREEMNYSMDSIDAMFGINTGARYPNKKPVLVAGGTTINNNHIAITNSQIGLLNTGSINNLNQTIDTLYSASQKELADNIKSFSETVLKEESLSDEQKTEVLESIDTITKELFEKAEKRKKSMANILLDKISANVGLAANALTIWQILHPLLKAYF